MATGPSSEPAHSPWSPFRHRTYAVIWTATVVANVGSWMYSAAAAWLMTSLDTNPVMVSLVQVATSLAIYPTGLPRLKTVSRQRLSVPIQIPCVPRLAWLQ
jgi:hypothetical protein